MNGFLSIPNFELEVQNLLNLFPNPKMVSDVLIKKYEQDKSSSHEYLCHLSQFMIQAGLYADLVQFLLKQFKRKKTIPWGHFAQALFLGVEISLAKEIQEMMIKWAKENHQMESLARCHFFDKNEKQIQNARKNYVSKKQEARTIIKNSLKQQIELLYTQNLLVEVDRFIEKLDRQFPLEEDVEAVKKSHQEKRAYRFFENVNTNQKQDLKFFYSEKNPDEEKLLNSIEETMNACLKNENLDPNLINNLIKDFSIAHLMWDNYEGSSRLISSSQTANEETLWLQFEVLLMSRRFVELLHFINESEKNLSQDPESTFAFHYFRAQCLWGLQRKLEAIDILEQIVSIRPQYRSAVSLLAEWKGLLS